MSTSLSIFSFVITAQPDDSSVVIERIRSFTDSRHARNHRSMLSSHPAARPFVLTLPFRILPWSGPLFCSESAALDD